VLSVLLGMDHSGTDLSLADSIADVPASELPYEEAVKFFRGRVSVTKAEWQELEPRLRFRAFTLARMESYDAIEKARVKLLASFEKTTPLRQSWDEIKNEGLSPFYWETVYRTNFQTAYNAGRQMQFEKSKPDALELIVIDDQRTSDICQALIGTVLPYNHPFWKTNWPPFHFNCRTTVRGVYKNDPEWKSVQRVSAKTLRKRFTPQSGFGGNPLDNGNYWMILPEMFSRGLQTGAIHEFNFMENEAAYHNKVWKGYKRERIAKGSWVDVHQDIKQRGEFPENHRVAKTIAKSGEYKIKMLPVHTRNKWKNADYLIGSELWELESLSGIKRSAVNRALRNGGKQAPNVILHIPQDADIDAVKNEIYVGFTRKSNPSSIAKLIIVQGDTVQFWSAEKIKNKWR
jgi:SPP1 gp7 family putative phage head morphogenesis protein